VGPAAVTRIVAALATVLVWLAIVAGQHLPHAPESPGARPPTGKAF
jgi:hypothetical protein